MSGSCFFSRRAAFSLGGVVLLACSADGLGQSNVVLAAGLARPIELVFIQGGEFSMGCPARPPKPWKPIDYCAPEHKVFVSPFWLGKYPVSVRQFCEYVNESGHTPSAGNAAVFFRHVERLTNGVYVATESKSEYPIAGVSFKDAEAYCAWLSEVSGKKCRLPTEAEWEFAAKGGMKNRTYPWGEEVKQTRPNPWGAPLGSHPELATPEGVFDLDGPVCQWCQDFFDEGYYAVSPYKDPVCNRGDGRRVTRGGPMVRVFGKSLFDEQLFLPPSWKRFQSHETDRTNSSGLRVVVQP